MATFFGEVSDLSSRALDEEETFITYQLSLEKISASDHHSTVLLIFAVGEIPSVYVNSSILPDDAEKLFQIHYSTTSYNDDASFMYTGGLKPNSKGPRAAIASAVNSKAIICEIADKLPDEILTELYQMIMKQISCSEAVVLFSQHVSNYKSAENAESPFLRALATSAYLERNPCVHQRILPPNFLSYFAATVLADFEIKKQPALCLIGYEDSELLDSMHVNLFGGLLKENTLVKLSEVSNSAEKIKKYVRDCYAKQSNMYT